MADAKKDTVGGVEPSMLVKYIGNLTNADSNRRIDLFQTDEGIPRSIFLGGDAVYVTPKEYSRIISGFQIEVLDKATADEENKSVNSEISTSSSESEASVTPAVVGSAAPIATTPPTITQTPKQGS